MPKRDPIFVSACRRLPFPSRPDWLVWLSPVPPWWVVGCDGSRSTLSRTSVRSLHRRTRAVPAGRRVCDPSSCRTGRPRRSAGRPERGDFGKPNRGEPILPESPGKTPQSHSDTLLWTSAVGSIVKDGKPCGATFRTSSDSAVGTDAKAHDEDSGWAGRRVIVDGEHRRRTLGVGNAFRTFPGRTTHFGCMR